MIMPLACVLNCAPDGAIKPELLFCTNYGVIRKLPQISFSTFCNVNQKMGKLKHYIPTLIDVEWANSS